MWCTFGNRIKVKQSHSRPDRPRGFQEVEAPTFQDSRHMKVVGLSALHIGRIYPPGNNPGTHFCYRPSRPQDHSAAGRIMSMKKFQRNNRESNPRPSGLQRCASTNRATACPYIISLKFPCLYHPTVNLSTVSSSCGYTVLVQGWVTCR
jgi:hypothetical protein